VAEWWFTLGFALALMATSAVLMTSHARTWRRFREQPLDEPEHDYRRRQFRRRMQTSAMLGVLAVAILVGQWVASPPLPFWAPLAYWSVTLVLVLWLGLLAAADVVSTRLHYDRLRDGYLVEQARLQAELRRLQRSRANGKPDDAS